MKTLSERGGDNYGKTNKRAAIIGGGASGLFCAILLARSGVDVTVFERQSRVGRKLLATGNGRCNFTNKYANKTNYYSIQGDGAAFVSYALERFSPEDAIAFFNDLGVISRFDNSDGRVYPYSFQSQAIADALRLEAARLGADVRADSDVTAIGRGGDLTVNGERLTFGAVVCAFGGAASPELGGGVSGLNMMKKAGVGVTATYPAICRVTTEKNPLFGLAGGKVDAAVRFIADGGVLGERRGDLLFTENGLSGNTIFELSVYCPLHKGLTCAIDFVPDMAAGGMAAFLRRQQTERGDVAAENVLSGIVHKKLGIALVKAAGGVPTKPWGGFGGVDALVMSLKNFTIMIKGTEGFKNAQVTAGGVSLGGVNPTTMGVKGAAGLYVIGEALDVYGDCGGFNLHWAWASSFVCAEGIVNDFNK